MKLYKISQEENNGYDTYSDAVVVAMTPELAKRIHPGNNNEYDRETKRWSYSIRHIPDAEDDYIYNWTNNPEHVKVVYLGEADSSFTVEEVICASFHAG